MILNYMLKKWRKGTGIETENGGHNLAGFDHFKSEILAELKRVKYEDLEDMVYRMELTYDEIVDILDIKYIPGSTIGYTLPPGLYEISDINLMLKSLVPNGVKVKITNDAIRLRSNLTTNKTIRFTKKSFIYTKIRFTQSHSGPLGDIEGFVQKIPGKYNSEKPINITGIDKVHLTVS